MIYAKDYGFLPGQDAEINAKALQSAIDNGGEIIIDIPGTYDISEPIFIGDDTCICFAEGAVIRRQNSRSGKNGYAFINKGAFTGKHNKNIKIDGLKIICNGVESTGFGKDSEIVGVRAHVVFLYIKNLEVYNYECMGLLAKDYGIQISSFENIHLENIHVEGAKDGVHLGRGNGFVIRHGRFRTYDDPIALNAFDYSVSNPNVGWIENGLIEDCYDLDDSSTMGFFCRMLGGSWVNWREGMEVQHSDTVVYNGRIYRVVMNPTDGKLYRSVTPPSHEMGLCEYDGINWVMALEGTHLDCGCRNIHLKNIHLEKKREIAIAIDFNRDTYARSYYPGSISPVQGNITFENIYIENDIPIMLRSNAPVDELKFINVDMKDRKIYLQDIEADGLEYPKSNITLENVTSADGNEDFIICDGQQSANIIRK